MGTARKNNGIMIRIGVIMGGQLVEERKFNTAHISVGELDRCTIVAPGCGYSRLELFERTATGYKLVPTAAKLAAKIRRGNTATMPSTGNLGVGDRGRLTLSDDVTLLFQLLPHVDVAPLRLPHGLRPSLISRMDRRVTLVVAASLLLHGVIAGYALSGDVEAAAPILGAPPEQFTLQTIDLSEPEPVVPVVPTNAAPTDQPATTPTVAAKPASANSGNHIAKPTAPAAPPAAEDPSKLREQAIAMANMLTGGPGGENNHELPQRTVGADLNKQIDAARTKTVSIGDTTHGTRDDGNMRPGTGHDPVIDPAHNQTTSITKTSAEPKVRFQTAPTAPGGDDLPEDLASRIANVYQAGLIRCYKSYMAGAGEAQGRVALKFSISETGRVTKADANGFADSLDQCIEGQMSNWHFKVPAEYSGADAVVSLQLLPGM